MIRLSTSWNPHQDTDVAGEMTEICSDLIMRVVAHGASFWMLSMLQVPLWPVLLFSCSDQCFIILWFTPLVLCFLLSNQCWNFEVWGFSNECDIVDVAWHKCSVSIMVDSVIKSADVGLCCFVGFFCFVFLQWMLWKSEAQIWHLKPLNNGEKSISDSLSPTLSQLQLRW